MTWITWIILGIAVLVGGFLLFAWIVGMVERLPVRPFVATPLIQPQSYTFAMAHEAAALGFGWLGAGEHVKNRTGKAVLMLSPDFSTLAVIGQGTVAKVPMKKTILYSRFPDGSVMMSVDQFGTAELDPLTTRHIALDAKFTDLWTSHTKELALRSPVVPFTMSDSWHTIDEINTQRTQRMVDAGLARWADREHAFFRYTPRGSYLAIVANTYRQAAAVAAEEDRRARVARKPWET